MEQTAKRAGKHDERETVIVPAVVPDNQGGNISLRSRWFETVKDKFKRR
jgi:hypothetical protein